MKGNSNTLMDLTPAGITIGWKKACYILVTVNLQVTLNHQLSPRDRRKVTPLYTNDRWIL